MEVRESTTERVHSVWVPESVVSQRICNHPATNVCLALRLQLRSFGELGVKFERFRFGKS